MLTSSLFLLRPQILSRLLKNQKLEPSPLRSTINVLDPLSQTLSTASREEPNPGDLLMPTKTSSNRSVVTHVTKDSLNLSSLSRPPILDSSRDLTRMNRLPSTTPFAVSLSSLLLLVVLSKNGKLSPRSTDGPLSEKLKCTLRTSPLTPPPESLPQNVACIWEPNSMTMTKAVKDTAWICHASLVVPTR
jgi:hypothetical protein